MTAERDCNVVDNEDDLTDGEEILVLRYDNRRRRDPRIGDFVNRHLAEADGVEAEGENGYENGSEDLEEEDVLVKCRD